MNVLGLISQLIIIETLRLTQGIDFYEIFSLVVKMSFIQVILELAANLDLELEQLDAKTAFLLGKWRKKSTCFDRRIQSERERTHSL
jgi:hypothetical protein